MTEQQLRDLLSGDIVQVAVPGHIHLLTLHPQLCTLENQPKTYIGWVSAWSTNSGQWIAIDPNTVVAVRAQNIDLSQSFTLN